MSSSKTLLADQARTEAVSSRLSCPGCLLAFQEQQRRGSLSVCPSSSRKLLPVIASATRAAFFGISRDVGDLAIQDRGLSGAKGAKRFEKAYGISYRCRTVGKPSWEATIIQRPTGLHRRLVWACVDHGPLDADRRSEGPVSGSVPPGPDQYCRDGLITIHNHDFMESPTFKAVYQREVKAAGTDYNWHWRAHIGLWAAAMASKLPGGFVGCGVLYLP